MIKSPLKYPGAKSRAIPKIAPLIPDFKEYRECFLGGGSVYLYVKQTYPNRKFWINDLYQPLFNFWKQSRYNVDKMIVNVSKWKSKAGNGHQLQQLLRINSHKFDDIEKGAAYFLWNRVSFAGLPRGCDENGFKTITDTKIDSLRDLSNTLQETQITNVDYSKLVEADGEDVFIFLDPPYFNIKWPELYGKSGGENLHTKFDHRKFAETMKKCKHKFLITYDDSNTVRKLFDWANIKEYTLTYSMTKYERTGHELFISNYEFPKEKQRTIEEAWN